MTNPIRVLRLSICTWKCQLEGLTAPVYNTGEQYLRQSVSNGDDNIHEVVGHLGYLPLHMDAKTLLCKYQQHWNEQYLTISEPSRSQKTFHIFLSHRINSKFFNYQKEIQTRYDQKNVWIGFKTQYKLLCTCSYKKW